MSKHSLPSIEKFAAYLDGNLSQDEMKLCEGLAENNETFRQLLGANSLVEETIASYNDVDFEVPEDILNQEFEIPSLDNESDMDDSVLDMKEHLSDFLSDGMKDNETPINLSGSEQNEQNKVMLNIEDINNSMEQTRQTIIEEAQKQYGLEPLNIDFDPNTYQWEQDTCAIRSQEIVLRSFGIDVSQSDLINEATSHGWYTKGQGTNLEDVGNLLDLHNIPNHRVENANVFNLVDELGQGHKVIVGVDVDELYGNSFWQSVKEFLIGKTPNHAMIVSGIDTSDPNNTMVVLTDPGTGKTLFECPYERFLSAWNDSECFMVATDDPAPLEFNSDTMINFDYDKGHVSFFGKILPNGVEIFSKTEGSTFYFQSPLPYLCTCTITVDAKRKDLVEERKSERQMKIETSRKFLDCTIIAYSFLRNGYNYCLANVFRKMEIAYKNGTAIREIPMKEEYGLSMLLASGFLQGCAAKHESGH